MNRVEVVGAVINRNGKILLVQRSCKNLNGKWEFAGGKVKDGETHQKALCRKIQEELNITFCVDSADH